jgi:hypothetical protein
LQEAKENRQKEREKVELESDYDCVKADIKNGEHRFIDEKVAHYTSERKARIQEFLEHLDTKRTNFIDNLHSKSTKFTFNSQSEPTE